MPEFQERRELARGGIIPFLIADKKLSEKKK